jgi:2-iminoacetate synthase ThiH
VWCLHLINRYTGVSLSDRTAEIMLKLIDDMENEIKRLEKIKKKQDKTWHNTIPNRFINL